MNSSAEITQAIESYVDKNCHSFPLTLRLIVITKTVKGQDIYMVSAYDRGFDNAVFIFKFNKNTFKRQLKKHNDIYLCDAANKRAIYG